MSYQIPCSPVVAETEEKRAALSAGDDLFERVLQRDNLAAAWKHMRANKGAAGIDGMSIEAFPAWARSGQWKRVGSELAAGRRFAVDVDLSKFLDRVSHDLQAIAGPDAAGQASPKTRCAIGYVVEEARLIAGTAHPFGESGTRAFIEKDFDHAGGYWRRPRAASCALESGRRRDHEAHKPRPARLKHMDSSVGKSGLLW